MKIAVTYENGQIFQHFGHTEQFKLYDTDGSKILSEEIVSTNGSGHGALAGFLKDNEADAVICGGVGAGAKEALEQAGIQLYGGISGNCDDAVVALLSGKLNYNTNATCSHHHTHTEHTCGEHSCGEHSCGSKE